MKLGILGDSHIGLVKFRKHEGFINKMTLLNNQAFEEAFQIFEGKEVDLIMHGGDLFDSPDPEVYSILKVNEVLERYKDIPTSIPSGNHDYSQRALIHGYHSFGVVNYQNKKHLNLYTDGVAFEKYDDHKVLIAYIPYKALGQNRGVTFEKIYREVEKSDYYKVLVFHGSIDYDDDRLNDEYDMPTEIADLFDFVTMGHVHYPKLIQSPRNRMEDGKLVSNDVYHLTPGSLMPSPKATQETQRPSVYVLDTETNEIEIINLKTPPYIFDYNTDDINQVLEEISEKEQTGIYSIRYNGKMSDIDDLTYMRALENSINISIQAEDLFAEVEVNKVKDFWTYITENYPQYENDFREVVSE